MEPFQSLISLGGGRLLLWADKFSPRNPWAIVLLLAGIASVLIFDALRPHHPHVNTRVTEYSRPLASIQIALA